jgi:hypothetical protein
MTGPKSEVPMQIVCISPAERARRCRGPALKDSCLETLRRGLFPTNAIDHYGLLPTLALSIRKRKPIPRLSQRSFRLKRTAVFEVSPETGRFQTITQSLGH